MANSLVRLPLPYVGDFNKGRPLFNAQIFIGEPDLDPEIPANQKAVTGRQEDGTLVTMSQPVRTSSGGYPIYNNAPIELLVDGAYSLKVLDKNDNQNYYFANVEAGRPVTFDDQVVFYRDTVAEAKADVNLTVGMYVTTKGYYSPNDDGGANYIVVAGGTGVDDGGSYHDMTNGNQLELLTDGDIYLEQWGLSGDGVTDDSTQFQNALNFISQDGAKIEGSGNYLASNLQAPDFTIWLNNLTLTTNAGYTITASLNQTKLLNAENCVFNLSGASIGLRQYSTWTPDGKDGFYVKCNTFNLSGGSTAIKMQGIWSSFILDNWCVGTGKLNGDIFIDTELGADLNTSIMNTVIRNNTTVTCQRSVRLVGRVGNGRIEGISIVGGNNFIATDTCIETTQVLGLKISDNQLSDCNNAIISNGDFNVVIADNCEVTGDVTGITINTLTGSITDSISIISNNITVTSGAKGVVLNQTTGNPLMRNIKISDNQIGKIGSIGGTGILASPDETGKIKAVIDNNNFYNMINGVDFGLIATDIEYTDTNRMNLVTNELLNTTSAENPTVILRRSFPTVATLTGGVGSETINIDIASLGLTSTPESVYVSTYNTFNSLQARYSFGSSSSTTLAIVFSRTDGSNTPAGSFRIGVLLEYEKDIEGNPQ